MRRAGGTTGKPARGGARNSRRWLASLAGVSLLLAGGLGWWTAPAEKPPTAAATASAAIPAPVRVEGDLAEGAFPGALPGGDLPGGDLPGEAAPAPRASRAQPQLSAEEREARRFNRYDKNKDGAVSREEFLAARRKAFERLDRNGDGLLDFEEYAITTITRFETADLNGDFRLSRSEFARTATRTATRQTARQAVQKAGPQTGQQTAQR